MKPNHRRIDPARLFHLLLLALVVALGLTGCPDDGEEDVRLPDVDAAVSACGNNVCDPGETAASCPRECFVCGNQVCEAGEASSCPADCAPPTSSLVVRNTSSHVVFRLFVRACGTTAWGADQLGANVIAAGASLELTGIPPRCYDLRAETSGTIYWQRTNVTFYAAQPYTWTLVN